MPKWLEKKLRQEGRKHGFKGKRLDRYVYGSRIMQNYLKRDRKKKK